MPSLPFVRVATFILYPGQPKPTPTLSHVGGWYITTAHLARSGDVTICNNHPLNSLLYQNWYSSLCEHHLSRKETYTKLIMEPLKIEVLLRLLRLPFEYGALFHVSA